MSQLTDALTDQTGAISKLVSIFSALTGLIVNGAQTKADLVVAQAQRDEAIAKYQELVDSNQADAETVLQANKALSDLLDAATSAIMPPSVPSPEATQVMEPPTGVVVSEF